MSASTPNDTILRRSSRKEDPTAAEDVQLSVKRHRHEYAKSTEDHFSDVKWDILDVSALRKHHYYPEDIRFGMQWREVVEFDAAKKSGSSKDKGFRECLPFLTVAEDAEHADDEEVSKSCTTSAADKTEAKALVSPEEARNEKLEASVGAQDSKAIEDWTDITHRPEFRDWASDGWTNPPGTTGRVVIVMKKTVELKKLAIGPWCEDREAAIKALLNQLKMGVLGLT